MTTLSSRKVSLSDHVKRRTRSSVALSSYGSNNTSANNSRGSGGAVDAGSSSSNSSSNGSASRSPQHIMSRSSRQHLPLDTTEGGYDSHAASYGNVDAPSHYCSSYGASEHGCYAAESYIGGYNSSSSPRRSNHNRPTPVSGSAHSGTINPRHDRYSPNPSIQEDIERQQGGGSLDNSSSSRRRSNHLQMSQASTIPMGQQHLNHPHHRREGSWEEESAYYTQYSHGYYPRSKDSSYRSKDGSSYSGHCPSAATSTVSTASTVSSSGGGSASVISITSSVENNAADAEAIRQGIIDISTLIATYVAGGLSFIFGIFLTLISPFVRIIKLIVGDVRGLLGESGFVQELGSLWRMYRELRRRSGRSTSSGEQGNHYHHNQYYDDESTEANSTVYTDNSSQFVGGWRPSVCPSVGSGSAGNNSASWVGTVASSGSSSRRSQQNNPASGSHSSLPLVDEDYLRHKHQGMASSQASGIETSSRGAMSYPPPNMGHPPRNNGNHYHPQSPMHYNNAAGYILISSSSSSSYPQHPRHASLPLRQYNPASTSPQKRRDSHQYRQPAYRSRSNIV